MRLAWLGVVVAAAGLVTAAVMWMFSVVGTTEADPAVCHNFLSMPVPCTVVGVDMTMARPLSVLVLVAALELAAVSIRVGRATVIRGRPRRLRRRGL